jgi:hypothetical protein
MLMFRNEDRGRVADGEITVTYRLWARAQVRAGQRYETGFGAVEVDDVQVMPAALVPESDIALTGCESIAAILASAGEHKRATITPATMLYRVQFRFVGDGSPRRLSNLDRG